MAAAQRSNHLRPSRTALALLCLAVPCMAPRAEGQISGTTPQASQSAPGGRSPLGVEPPDPLAPGAAARMQHMREDERHKRLIADTARLVALSNELKEEVDKAGKDELSVAVVRKAAEIERLAKDVRERMRY